VLISEIVAEIVADKILLDVEVTVSMRGVDVCKAVIDAVDDLDVIEVNDKAALLDTVVDNVASVETLLEPVIEATPVLCADTVAVKLMPALDDPLVETLALSVDAADDVLIIVGVFALDMKADNVEIGL